mmetsp:Transcript_39793/g.84934  ORF Transcript_39793/g.84934 Transcript_39793/m.84934 type:complete len:192 (-) Transcript_39793:89-664(-)
MTEAPLHGMAKLAADKLCGQALNSAETQQMKVLHSRRSELLRQQQELSKGIRQKVGEDIVVQSGNVKACHVAIKNSRQAGMVRYTHATPPSELGRETYSSTVGNLQRLSNELDAVRAEEAALEKAQKKKQQAQSSAPAACDSLGAWFDRYGAPKVQAEKEQKVRSVVMKPRWKPMVGFSSAQTLRKGHLIS